MIIHHFRGFVNREPNILTLDKIRGIMFQTKLWRCTMTELSQKILASWQVRKKRDQKTAFIEFMKGEIPSISVEEGGLGKNRNLIVGDPKTAKVIVGAHYDTCAALPFPNFITPKNFLVYILYNLLLLAPMIALIAVFFNTANVLFYFLALGYIFGLSALMLLGKPNAHTVNDNTSGVVALCELWASLSDDEKAKTALVFFDNEENGLLGSRFYRTKHKTEIKHQLMINLDCISDGDYIMVIKSATAQKSYGDLIDGTFASTDAKTVVYASSANTLYPSDQSNFPHHVAVAALKKNRLVGYYLDRIHTKHDTNFDRANIALVCGGIKSLIAKI